MSIQKQRPSLMLLAAVMLSMGTASAQVCKSSVKVLAQPRDGIVLLEKYKDEFKALSGASFEMDKLGEGDRRAESREDAASVGKYNVYYLDEANVALFARSNWVVPLLKYYPKEYDYGDFDEGSRRVATVDGTQWFAPVSGGGGDLLVYRKDLLEKAGIEPPRTLDALIAAVKKLHDPANGVYGTALRGQRGSGANVWRWMPYFKGFGGQWFDGNKPVFNSEAAVKATETYLDLFKYSVPGSQNGSGEEATNAFLAGKVALLIESTSITATALDPKLSAVSGRVGFLPPPTPLTGGGGGHGFAIGAKANKSEADRQCAGLFIAWATSKKNEERRLAEGQFGELNRSSIYASEEFGTRYGPDLGPALAQTGKVSAVNFWQDTQWPDLGDRWGIILEELITGKRSDVKGSLDELQDFAEALVANKRK